MASDARTEKRARNLEYAVRFRRRGKRARLARRARIAAREQAWLTAMGLH